MERMVQTKPVAICVLRTVIWLGLHPLPVASWLRIKQRPTFEPAKITPVALFQIGKVTVFLVPEVLPFLPDHVIANFQEERNLKNENKDICCFCGCIEYGGFHSSHCLYWLRVHVEHG
jgi:hypothetical protein